ncbi:hypothetical protein E2C01_102040 [Portunus trituberculatus]|uniref:Uncharacterized protein n=1 Tax=Portunus trituberculatus TaxID=210409 RepID=A0A5B7KGB6_PORTR|nr:hypothetical protein [Portunus trituberculatus]
MGGGSSAGGAAGLPWKSRECSSATGDARGYTGDESLVGGDQDVGRPAGCGAAEVGGVVGGERGLLGSRSSCHRLYS